MRGIIPPRRRQRRSRPGGGVRTVQPLACRHMHPSPWPAPRQARRRHGIPAWLPHVLRQRERSPYDHLTFYLLDDKGFTVLVPPTPLRGPLAGGDDAYLAGYLAAVPGPIILVGHSYWLYPRRGRSQRSARRAAGQRWACRAHRTPYTGFAQCFALSSCRTQHLRPTRASPRERPRRRRT